MGIKNQMVALVRWLVFSVITGVVLGLVSTAFGKSVLWVTAFRTANPWILYGLPLAGILIVWTYQWEREEKSSTNLVLDAIHSEK